jgi:Terminase small subunit
MPLSTRLLTNAAIAAAIKKAIDARAVRTGITTDRVLKELELVAFSRITDGVNGTES